MDGIADDADAALLLTAGLAAAAGRAVSVGLTDNVERVALAGVADDAEREARVLVGLTDKLDATWAVDASGAALTGRTVAEAGAACASRAVDAGVALADVTDVDAAEWVGLVAVTSVTMLADLANNADGADGAALVDLAAAASGAELTGLADDDEVRAPPLLVASVLMRALSRALVSPRARALTTSFSRAVRPS